MDANLTIRPAAASDDDANERAVRLWQSCGFEIVSRLPGAFEHPRLGAVDALVRVRSL